METPNKVKPTRILRFYEKHGSLSRSIDQNYPRFQSGHKSSNGKRKLISLKYIYDDLDVSSNFALLSFQHSSFEEAIKDENWVQSMDEEIEAIEKNDTWDLVDLSKDKNLIGVKWVYKTKLNEKGEIDIFKARLVGKGLSKQLRIYFEKTFVHSQIGYCKISLSNNNSEQVFIKWMRNQPS